MARCQLIEGLKPGTWVWDVREYCDNPDCEYHDGLER